MSRRFSSFPALSVSFLGSLLICASFPAHSASPRAPISLYSAGQRQASFHDCKELFPLRQALPLNLVSAQWQPRALCSDAFAVLHSGLSKTPLVVIERLNRAQIIIAKGERRTDKFYADPRLPTDERAHPQDYKGSGWSRGHLAAAGNAHSVNAMAQTFALSNMVPQDAKHNSGVWNKLEDDTRKYALRARGDVFVYSGPLFDKGHSTIGRNRVYVPTRMFKLVFDPVAQRAWAHVLPNTAKARLQAPMDYAQFVRTTGLRLLPPGALKP